MKPGKTFVQVVVVLFPALLLVMVIVGIALFEQRRVDKVEEFPISHEITAKTMVAQYVKLRDFMTPRSFTGDVEQEYMKRTVAFIGGSLSFPNTGMSPEVRKAHTEDKLIWKDYSLSFGSGKEELEVVVNYASASNAELAVALSMVEVLPRMELSQKLTIRFSPVESNGGIDQWVKEARMRGAGQPLMTDGIDWPYLITKVRQYIEVIEKKDS